MPSVRKASSTTGDWRMRCHWPPVRPKPRLPPSGLQQAHVDHAIGIGVGIRIDHDGVDNAEDGGGGSDAEGERNDRRQGEARHFDQLPEAVAEVVHSNSHRVSLSSADLRRFSVRGNPISLRTRLVALC